MAPRPVTPHSILVASLEALHARLEETDADADTLAASRRCLDLAAPLDDYLVAVSSPPSDALRALEAETQAIDWDQSFADQRTEALLEQEMVSGALEGQFLKMLVAISGARRVLEVGVFTGYSALAMAEALPAGGRLVGCEKDPFAASFARRQFAQSAAGRTIEIREGDASETLNALADDGETFDLAFVDADKGGYLGYVRTLLDRGLVGVGGLICADNTLYQGEVYAPGDGSELGRAVAAFNRAVADDPRVEQVVIPMRDGLTLIRRVA